MQTIVTFKVRKDGKLSTRFFYEACPIGKVHAVAHNLFAPSYFDEAGELVDDESPEAEYTDCDGNSVGLTNAMISSGIGEIVLDGLHLRYYSKHLANCDCDELLIIQRDDKALIRKYFENHTKLKVEWDRVPNGRYFDIIMDYFYNHLEPLEEYYTSN